MFSYLVKHRRPIVVSIHVVLIILANYCAFLLRFDGSIDRADFQIFYQALPWLVVIRIATFALFRLHQGLWRYAGIWDLSKIVQACVISTVLFAISVRDVFPVEHYPISIYFLDAIVLLTLMGGARLVRRFYHELGYFERGKRVLLYGAGDAGEMIVRDMKHNPYYSYEPVGFVDDDSAKVGHRVHGIPVLGSHVELPWIIERTLPQEILIAMPSATPETLRTIVGRLEDFKIPIRTLPNLRNLLDGHIDLTQIRDLELEDLLARPKIELDNAPVRSLVAGKRILVTGGAGSVGSELCRQLVSFGPATVLACDRSENGLFLLQQEFAGTEAQRQLVPIIADVTDMPRMCSIMSEWSPPLVFYAAAYTHVPLMQDNPCEAVKNNVVGTRVVIDCAIQTGVERLIFISTDKAVNPTSIMGATKRVAELLVQARAHGHRSHLVCVRFGNVLGSNGSVIPEFLRQVKSGGPLTVTHPEIRRYFMLIPEAVQLVLHAAASGYSGSIYVLEMGEQIRIVDMARNLVRLAGFVPDVEIPIKFIGLRPGEKLFEELVGEDESARPSGLQGILQVESRANTCRVAMDSLEALEAAATAGEADTTLRMLHDIVPTFQMPGPPQPSVFAAPWLRPEDSDTGDPSDAYGQHRTETRLVPQTT